MELFFNWIKQHVRIKRFLSTSENAVKTQVWIAIALYVLVAIIKKRLNNEISLYSILQKCKVRTARAKFFYRNPAQMNSRTNLCVTSHSLRMLSTVLACGLCVYASSVTAQSAYPSKPIRLISSLLQRIATSLRSPCLQC